MTSRLVGPSPETYALCFVVLRLASATSVVRTGTPACSESPRRSRASSSSASGSKRLKSRSKSSGASRLNRSASKAAPSAAGTGHHVGQMRADQTSAVRPRPARTAPRDSPLATSPSHAPNDCVEKPQRRSQTQPRQAESGSRTSSGHDEHEHRQLERPRPPGPAGRLPEPVARWAERDQHEHGQLQRPVGEERQVERPMVVTGARNLSRGKRIRSFHVEVGELSANYTASMSAGPVVGRLSTEDSRELGNQWRALRRAATAVAVLSSPALFVWLYKMQEVTLAWAIVATILGVAAFRGLLDLIFHRFIEWPSLFGIDNADLREEDVVARRRVWFWRWWAKIAWFILLIIFAIYAVRVLKYGIADASLVDTAKDSWNWLASKAHVNGQTLGLLFTFGIFFIFNFGILMGPMLFMGISQIRGFEPGDADWGVKLDDVRGQKEAKEEVRRVVNLWQSGEAFEKAGGRRERGLLFLGAPGTGKTMLAKAIATGFNSPIVTIPGSGFAQTFMGMDVVIVRYMARKAKKLARKWGGQCIVFIDEIDAVGMRRQSLGGAMGTMTPRPQSFHDLCFHGPNGALTPSEDLILESRAWRERLFARTQPARRAADAIPRPDRERGLPRAPSAARAAAASWR